MCIYYDSQSQMVVLVFILNSIDKIFINLHMKIAISPSNILLIIQDEFVSCNQEDSCAIYALLSLSPF